MEFCNLLQHIFDVFQIFPRVPFYAITFPFDQVLKTSLEHPTVQNLFHNVFLFTIHKFWGWGCIRKTLK